MQIEHYIFTSTGNPIKIELDFRTGMAKVEGKWIAITELEKQTNAFLNCLERYKQKAKGKPK
jgi:hypothetical protein